MNTSETNLAGTAAGVRSSLPPAARPSYLHLVTSYDVRDLREALAKGRIPFDLRAKLIGLAEGDLSHGFIEQHCRTMLALLLAAEEGSFRRASPGERDRLLRVLAYVRKDDDAIPDYQPNGFDDDRQEVRAALTELGPLLGAFKAWRLRHQVPGMWPATRRP